jgi:hypothetical protein
MNQHSSKEYIQLINCYVHLLSEETEIPSVKETVDSGSLLWNMCSLGHNFYVITASQCYLSYDSKLIFRINEDISWEESKYYCLNELHCFG